MLLRSGLSEEVGALRRRLAQLRRIHSTGDPVANGPDAPLACAGRGAAQRRTLTLVESALSHLRRHVGVSPGEYCRIFAAR
jgi:hypothetical protein